MRREGQHTSTAARLLSVPGSGAQRLDGQATSALLSEAMECISYLSRRLDDAAAASGTAQPLPQQQHVLGGEGAEYARRLRDEEAGVDAKAAAAAAAAAAAPLPPAPPSMPRAPPPAPAAPPSAQALARAQQAQVAALVGQAQQARTLRFDETSFFSSSSTMSDAAGISAASARKSPARAGAGKSVAEAVALAGSPSRFAATRSIDVW